MSRSLWLLVGGVLAALAVGIGLEVLTWLVARYGPEGGAWSLRGNGSLIVPFGLGPAVLAGAWSALVLHARGAERWVVLSIAAALVGLVLIGIGLLVLGVAGRTFAGQVAANWLFLSVLGWMLAAPLVAALAPVKRLPPPNATRAMHAVTGVLATLCMLASFVAVGRVLPPGS